MDKCRGAYGRARTGEPFAKHFHDKYGDKHDLPPYWMLVNVMDFGMVVTLYKGSPVLVRQQIAGDLGLELRRMRSSCGHANLASRAFRRIVCGFTFERQFRVQFWPATSVLE